MIGGYLDEGGDIGEQSKWRSASLQGCPREVRLLLAGLYYYDVDMVNSLPNVARQLARLGMVSASNLQALCALCRDAGHAVLGGIVEHYGLVGSPALGVTARDVAKGLPVQLLHGGGHAAWLPPGSSALVAFASAAAALASAGSVRGGGGARPPPAARACLAAPCASAPPPLASGRLRQPSAAAPPPPARRRSP